jgi:hypothetical protein
MISYLPVAPRESYSSTHVYVNTKGAAESGAEVGNSSAMRGKTLGY